MAHKFIDDLKERLFIIVLSMIDPDESHERWVARQKRLQAEREAKEGMQKPQEPQQVEQVEQAEQTQENEQAARP